MNILEAVKSGRRFKRPMEDHYWDLIEKDGVQWLSYGPEKKLEPWSVCFMTANDWELEPEQKIELTKSQIVIAIRDAVVEKLQEKKLQFYPNTAQVVEDHVIESIQTILKKLGFQ